MVSRTQGPSALPLDPRPKWLNAPATFHEGSLSAIRKLLPAFERRDFVLPRTQDEPSKANERLDMIVRLPFGDDKASIPVGVVSKDYTLVSHRTVLDIAARALCEVGIAPDDVTAKLKITDLGERMELSLYLPGKYEFDPGDGHPMALRLECLNSVDGSTRFRALMGWYRFVCSNGLIIGVTRSDVHRRHVGDLKLEDVGVVLRSGLAESASEKKNFERWRKIEVSPDRLASWVDKSLRKGWGFKAAARAFHIAQTGSDAEVVGQYKGNIPTSIAMRRTERVPGSPLYCRNLFDLSQVLAWLAKERRDIHEQLEWREGIPELMKPLLN